MRFTYISKIIIYFMFTVVVISLIKTIIKGLHEKNPGIKYILLWTKQENVPFVYMGIGRSGFVDRKCPYTNCIVSGNESLLGSVTAFDVVAFAGPELVQVDETMLPARRLPYQKYVFVSIESPQNYPLCYRDFDGYFNWTWTYKLDSEVRWGYIVIRDLNNNIIGPNKIMHWLDPFAMEPVSETFKQDLKSKKKAIAWFVSNCRTKSRREGYAQNLRRELNKYGLVLDIYGKCGWLTCPRNEDKCNKMISTDYYFYLSFENAFSEDYVTEKLLIPLQNNAVPIVYGGANYSRFLPKGSYLNAREMGIYRLAKKIDELIKNPDLYADFFKWKNHYSYHRMSDSIETNEYCKICAALNDEESMSATTVYKNFNDWWEISELC